MQRLFAMLILAYCNMALAEGKVTIIVADGVDEGRGQLEETLSIRIHNSLESQSRVLKLDSDTHVGAVVFAISPGKISYELSAKTKVDNKLLRSSCDAKGILNITHDMIFGFAKKTDPRDGDYKCFLRDIADQFVVEQESRPRLSLPPQMQRFPAPYGHPRRPSGSDSGTRQTCLHKCQFEYDDCLSYCPSDRKALCGMQCINEAQSCRFGCPDH